MNTLKSNLKMILALISTSLLSVACSGGGLPDNMDATSTAAQAVAAPLPLRVTASATSISTGSGSAVNVSGGTPPYTALLSNAGLGTLSSAIIASGGSTTFTGGAAGTVEVIVTDSALLSAKVSIQITAPYVPPVNPPPEISREARAINLYYLWSLYDDGVTVYDDFRSFSTDQGLNASWKPLGKAYSVFVHQVNGSVPLYQCLEGGGQPFESLADNCEGQQKSRILGYVMPTGGAGLVAINRYTYYWQDMRFNGSTWYGVGGGHVDHRTTSNGNQLYNQWRGDSWVFEKNLGYGPQ